MLPSLTLLLLCGLIAAPTVGAGPDAQPEDGSGLVLRVDEVWMAPRNNELDFAFLDVGSLSGGGTVLTLEHDRSAVPAFYVGWRLASASRAEIGARLWEYDENVDSTTGLLPDQVGALLGSPDFKITNVDSATARGDLRADVVDVTVTWAHELGEGRFEAGVGVRLFGFEETRTVTYELGADREILVDSVDSSGVGPSAGFAYHRRLGRRFSLGGRLGLAVPIGDIEAQARDLKISAGTDLATFVDRPGTTRAFVQLDFEVRLRARLGAGWSANAAYTVAHWSGIRKGLRFVDDVAQAVTLPVEEDVLFEGPFVGLSYEF